MGKRKNDFATQRWITVLLLLVAGAALLVGMMYRAPETACIPQDVQPEKLYYFGRQTSPMYLRMCITDTDLNVGEQAVVILETVNFTPQFPGPAIGLSGVEMIQTGAGGETALLLKIVDRSQVAGNDHQARFTVEAVHTGEAQVEFAAKELMYPPEISRVYGTMFSHPLTIRVKSK
jgi:hypothetical protein